MLSLNKILLVSILCVFTFHLVLLPILGLYGYDEVLEVKKNNFPADRPIPEKQDRVRGNKNIFKVGLTSMPDECGIFLGDFLYMLHLFRGFSVYLQEFHRKKTTKTPRTPDTLVLTVDSLN